MYLFPRKWTLSQKYSNGDALLLSWAIRTKKQESILFLMFGRLNKLLIEGRVYGREEIVSKTLKLCVWQRRFPQFVINDVALLTRISLFVFVIRYIKALVISSMAKKCVFVKV